MTSPSVTEPVPKRADQLVVGDRISREKLPAFSVSDADVVFVRVYELHGERWVFVAYLPDDGNYDSVTYRADGSLDVYPADPTGATYSDHADRMTVETAPVPPTVKGLAVGDSGEFGVVHPAAGDQPEGFCWVCGDPFPHSHAEAR